MGYKVCIGGTFDILHRGHKILINTAFKKAGDGFVFIGLADGDLIKSKENVKNIDKRTDQLVSFVESKDYMAKYEIKPIFDIYGPTISEDFDIIVVSKDSRKNAEKINSRRKKAGLNDLKIVVIPMVLGDDGKPISSTRIKKREIDKKGNIIE